jgi:protein phosphatase
MSISYIVGRHRIRFAGVTDVGRVRAHNEDALLIPNDGIAIAVVSDGMGGHAAGDVASRLTVETIGEYYGNTGEYAAPTFPLRLPPLEAERNRMSTAVKLANSRIFEVSQRDADKKGMGCTVDAIYFAYGRFYIGHVGDSRVYRIRDGQMRQLTEDHSLLNDYRRMKEMAGEPMESVPSNVVVRALGLAERVYVDIVADECHAGDTFLLCSDGLNDMLSDEEILEVATRPFDRLDQPAQRLVDAANEAGGKDNITALLCAVENA